MNRWIMVVGLLALASLLLAACGGAAGAVSANPALETSLDLGYDGALPVRSQLLLGTLRLEESGQPLAAAQAATLLPLWQGIRGTMNSGAAAQEETDALLRQIEKGMSAEQLAAIRGWKLTQADLQEWGSRQGISAGSGNAAGGGGSGIPGEGQPLSPEARATRQAERGGGEERGGVSRALVEAVIALLETK